VPDHRDCIARIRRRADLKRQLMLEQAVARAMDSITRSSTSYLDFKYSQNFPNRQTHTRIESLLSRVIKGRMSSSAR
jgi:hypothetical protein